MDQAGRLQGLGNTSPVNGYSSCGISVGISIFPVSNTWSEKDHIDEWAANKGQGTAPKSVPILSTLLRHRFGQRALLRVKTQAKMVGGGSWASNTIYMKRVGAEQLPVTAWNNMGRCNTTDKKELPHPSWVSWTTNPRFDSVPPSRMIFPSVPNFWKPAHHLPSSPIVGGGGHNPPKNVGYFY